MSQLRITIDGPTAKLAGFIGADAVMEPICAHPAVTTLDFGAVTGMNSPGVQRFAEFVDTWNGRRFAYTSCPPFLVDAFVMIPSLLGPAENTARIKSLHIPYECRACDTGHAMPFSDDQLRSEEARLVLPQYTCPKCKKPMQLAPDVETYNDLIAMGALTPCAP